MATPDRPKGPASPRPVVPPPIPRSASLSPAPAAAQRSSDAGQRIVSAAVAGVKETLLEKRPYLKWAFANPYNLSLLLGGVAASVLTLNPLPAITVLGLESLWLLYAPDSKRLQHLLWDPKFARLKEELLQQQREQRMQGLTPSDRQRIQELLSRQQQINQLAGRNPSFTGDLLRTELMKTDRLVDAFIDMAATSSRYEEYLRSVDIGSLDADRLRLERLIKFAKDGDSQADLAKKNLAIILKRQDKMKEIRRYLEVARGQLDLIENSFQLIADQIVTMQSPQELSGQLNELLDGVESIRQTAAETEALLNTA